jgi:hypothetical protein
MSPARLTPLDLVFGEDAGPVFARVEDAVRGAGRDPAVRDEFVLVREVAELLHGLRPEEGLGDRVEALVGFVHTSYLFWHGGRSVREVPREALDELAAGPAETPKAESGTTTIYFQLPALAVWGSPVAGGVPEPLDGWFATRRNDRLILLAIFGLHPGRDGFTTVEISGPRPDQPLLRPDGTPLFTPRLSGGAAAGLYSVDGEEELLELGWRVDGRLRPDRSAATA